MQYYNELTKRLFAQGYTEESFPDYIKEYNSFYGGYIYKADYRESIVYLTGCGIEITGKDVIGTMMYLGQDWSYENFNPVIVCPYAKSECEDNHPLLKTRARSGLDYCACHPKEEGECPDKTLKEVQAREEDWRKRALAEYKTRNAGHYCLNHMRYSKESNQWILDYKPLKCEYCSADTTCSLWGRNLSPVKGNVYYDSKVEYASEDTILDESVKTVVYRAIPVLKANVSMTICEQIASFCADEILKKEFYHPYDMPTLIKSKNFNIRALETVLPDEAMDRQEALAGATIIYHRDIADELQRKKDQTKSELIRRKEQEAREFILENGFEELKGYEKRRLLKYLSWDQITFLTQLRERRLSGNELFAPYE